MTSLNKLDDLDIKVPDDLPGKVNKRVAARAKKAKAVTSALSIVVFLSVISGFLIVSINQSKEVKSANKTKQQIATRTEPTTTTTTTTTVPVAQQTTTKTQPTTPTTVQSAPPVTAVEQSPNDKPKDKLHRCDATNSPGGIDIIEWLRWFSRWGSKYCK